MYGGAYAPIEIHSVNGELYVPPEAREEINNIHTLYFAFKKLQMSVDTSVIAPAHLVYEGSGLNSYIINTYIETDDITHNSGYGLFPRHITVTLKARMTDATAGDLSAMALNSITHAYSGNVDYNALDWSLSASYHNVGAHVNLHRGDSVSYGYSDSTTASGSGASGAWRTLGYADYNWGPFWGQGFDRKIATDFELTMNSIAMGDLKGHNIQFGIDIYVRGDLYHKLFGFWYNFKTEYTYSYVLGDGFGQTSNPQNYADTWIVALPGSISLLEV